MREGQSLLAGAYTVSDMKRRLAAALIFAALAVGGLAAVLLLRDGGDGDDALARMSAPERRFDPTVAPANGS